MLNITKMVLKRPVTALLVVLSLVFFGFISIFQNDLELTPDINMPMLIITTTYAGASPEDIDELITKEIEESCGTLSGLDSITSYSMENYGLTLLQYEYGTDMDNAYTELRKKLDGVKSDLPDDADDPSIIEMDINSMASMYVVVQNSAVNSIYNYADKTIIPELEKQSAVASVDISGGAEDYISVQLIPEKISQYHLDISTVAQLVGAASFSIPGGTTDIGSTEMSVSAGVEYLSVDELKRVPITAGNGNILYLEDIAVVSRAQKEVSSYGSYNGSDALVLGINRNTKYTAVTVSDQSMKVLNKLEASDPNLDFIVIYDGREQIMSSVKTMIETLLLAVVISTVILFIFYGDVKASLIVATSIPVSLLTAFVVMWARDYSLNMITLGATVIGVGMMVDNSVVILESCFRSIEKYGTDSFKNYVKSAVLGTGEVSASVLGGTITTCVVFLPLAFLNGLTGQFFQPLGFVIVFCMCASLLSACSLVPLCFVAYRPVENEKAPAYKAIRSMQSGYRKLMRRLMKHKPVVMIVTLVLFAGTIALATRLNMKLMPDIDQGQISVDISVRPGLNIEKQKEIYSKVEAIVLEDEDLDKYMVSSGSSSMMSGGSSSLTAYLKDKRKKTTAETVELWKEKLQHIDDCDISVELYSEMSSMNVGDNFSVSVTNADYDDLKRSSDAIAEALRADPRFTKVTSTTDNGSPLVKIKVDPVAANAEGLNPAQISGSLYTMMNGSDVDDMDIDGQELSIIVEYPKDEFDSVEKVGNISFTSTSGNQVMLKDIAEITIEDSPVRIQRSDKQYYSMISADYTDLADKNTEAEVMKSIVEPNLTNGTTEKENSQMEMLNDEFTNLFVAIAIAVFLVFVVMAAQFESPRFSFMVMTTIPFALIGAVFLLWVMDIDLSMTSMIGFLMLIGTVVNNGILYVDTVNTNRRTMDLETSLIEAGAVRLRPILMTTLTTILSMVPLFFGTGNAEMMHGLAAVNIGGLTASTVMALIVLPVYYYYMNGKRVSSQTAMAEAMEKLEEEGEI